MHLSAPVLVSESGSLTTVAAVLLKQAVSCAILREPPLRVVTEHDLATAWAQDCQTGNEVASIATSNPCWAPVSASVAEAAALMVSLGIRHLVVLSLDGQPMGVVSMSEIFSVLVRVHEPVALYAAFAEIILRSGTQPSGTFVSEFPLVPPIGGRVGS